MVRYYKRRSIGNKNKNKNLNEVVSIVISLLALLLINFLPLQNEEGLLILLMKQLFAITNFLPFLIGAIVVTIVVEIYGFMIIREKIKLLINRIQN